MSSAPHRRRHSPAVYRRRRLAVLLVLILLIAGIWLLIARPWAGAAEATAPTEAPAEPVLPVVTAAPTTPDDTASPTPDGTASPTPDATESAPPETPGATPAPTVSTSPIADACDPDDVDVTAVTDKTSYAAGEDPKLSLTLVNNGSKACALNVGTAAQVFTISSGGDDYWRSTDCQATPSDMVVMLKAGQKVSSASTITWDRTRSSVATCDAKNRPVAGAGTYQLTVEIGGIKSETAASFQLK